MKTILVTGAAGFVGFHYAKKLCETGLYQVVGLDNLNHYYDPALKKARLDILKTLPNFTFHEMDISARAAMKEFFAQHKFHTVVHLAAQAGVRYSIDNPHAYVDSNLEGFMNILEGCRHSDVAHLIYASSSSVYGANTLVPFSTAHNVDHPISLYAATKKAGELMAHTYAHLYNLPCTGLRFFTVYGPWGRPDMAYFKFTEKILKGEPIEIFNHGDMRRDFTYIDDIVESMLRLLDHPAKPDPHWSSLKADPSTSSAPYHIYNIGNNNPENLLDFVDTLEDLLGKKAVKNMMPMQPGDVYETYADCSDLEDAVGFKPNTKLRDGLTKFVAWYKDYYGLARAA
ncbi:MAG TPA: NAD-dependent epimerase [Alphaproteobacteria bacterium]|nr:NAD-dependent epimerase [Alphaproteobacteria bacterium]